METPADSTPPAETETEYDGRDGRPFIFVGLCFVALSFVLSWWSLTKYRVEEQRGVDLSNVEQAHEIERQKNGESEAKYQVRLKEYRDRLHRYQHAWEVNQSQYGDFYRAHVGDDYLGDLGFQDQRTLKSGTIYFRGWSTWTGWFGALGLVLLLATQVAPRFAPQLAPWAWAFPWAGAAWFGLFTLLAIAFFFNVPDENGDGYSQGVGFGNYFALLGGAIAATGCVFYGLQTADERLAFLQSRSKDDDEEDEEEEEDEPPKPVKNRLQDW
jgi:hypothetical protein